MATKRKKVKPVPAGYHTVTPYLACGEAARAIEFYKKAFGAKESCASSTARWISSARSRAVAVGATLIQPAQDKFYGDRTGSVKDPFGHVWHIATHIEDLSMAELKKARREGDEGDGRLAELR